MREIKSHELDNIYGGLAFLAPLAPLVSAATPFLWGCVAGAVSYLAGHKGKPMTVEGFAAQTVSTGVTGQFATFGTAGRVLGLINTANTVATIPTIENK